MVSLYIYKKKKAKELEVFAVIHVNFQMKCLFYFSICRFRNLQKESESQQLLKNNKKDNLLKQILGPHNAMDRFRWRISDCAAWKSLLSWFRMTFITFCHSLVKSEIFTCHAAKATGSICYYQMNCNFISEHPTPCCLKQPMI